MLVRTHSLSFTCSHMHHTSSTRKSNGVERVFFFFFLVCVSIPCVSPHIISCCRQHTRMHTERSLCTRRGRRSRQPKILHQRKKKDVSRSITHTRFPRPKIRICHHAPNSSCPLAYTYPCKYVHPGYYAAAAARERERERSVGMAHRLLLCVIYHLTSCTSTYSRT